MIDPVEFYQFAGQLYANNKEHPELENRIIIGRAYYAAFLCARAYSQINSSNANVHGQVISYFEKRNEFVGNLLKTLKNLRQKADYRPELTLTRREAAKALKLAKNILEELNFLP